MGNIASQFATAFRDFVTDGVASSGPHEVVKGEVRAIGPLIEAALGAVSLGSVDVIKDTRANLNSDLAYAADSVGLVYGDATGANNDLYIKVGASGSGSWTLTTILHDALAAAMVNNNPSFATDNGPIASAAPSAYPFGQSGYEVNSGEGWPAFGYLVTDRSGSGTRAVQTMHVDGYGSKVFRRVAVANDDSWQGWEEISGSAAVHSGQWMSFSTTGIAIASDPFVINAMLIWGQSNAEANTVTAQTLIAGSPLNSTVGDYVLMGDCGARVDLRVGNDDIALPDGPPFLPYDPLFTDFEPCHEAINSGTFCYETALTSALTHTHQFIHDGTGLRTTWAGATIARSSYSAQQLKQGRGAFEYSRQWLIGAVQAARAAGKRVIVRAIPFRCTETDATNDTPAPILAETFVELAAAANAMVKSITGQTEDVWFILDAAQSPDVSGPGYNDLVEAQRIAAERCYLIKLGPPYYQHPRSSTGSPEFSIHLNATGQNNTGVDYARLICDLLAGTFAPSQPYFARFSNVARTQITVQCPYTPDVDLSGSPISLTGLKGRYGIVMEDDSGAAPTITGHSISGKNIIFTLSGAPTGPNPRLIIGQIGNDSGDPYGPITGPRTAWYFSGRDRTNLWNGDTVRDWFRPCTLKL
jgi:hypothetical protein